MDNDTLSAPPSGTTERFIPSASGGQWIADTSTSISLYDSAQEIGAAYLYPSGTSYKAIFFGATGNTAIYTPTSDPDTTKPGAWAAGPSLPLVPVAVRDANGNPVLSNGVVQFQKNPDNTVKYVAGSAGDAPGAMMANGKVLFIISETNVSNHQPAFFCEFDPATNSMTAVSGPTGSYDNVTIADEFNTLALPDGNILFSDTNAAGTLYLYQPDGLPIPAGKPVIGGITRNSDGSYHLTGTGLNGISEGAAYGDEAQMSTNFPLVQMIDGTGTVSYGRTYNWSSIGVMTGNLTVSTDFSLPPGAVDGTYYSLAVVTNGISSDHILFIANPPPPVVTVTAPASHSTIAAFSAVTGTATDNGGPGISANSVNFSIFNANSGQYWDGIHWSNTQSTLAAAVNETTHVWSWAGQLPNIANGTLQSGTYLISAGTHFLKAGASFRGPGRGRVSGGYVTLLGGVTAGQSVPAVTGSFEATGTGGLDGAGSLSLVGGSGTFAWSGSGSIFTTVSVGAGSQLMIDTTDSPYLNSGILNNAGTAVLSGGGVLQGANNAAINNTGVFQINRSGTIAQNNGNAATLRNDGILNLLPSASAVTLGWDFIQSATGTLNLKIGGSDPVPPQFDRIAFGGSVALGGTLNVSLINGFVPAAGNEFVVLAYGSQTGSFANFHSLGASFTRHYNAGDLTLTATQGPANYAEWKNVYFGAGSPDAGDNADPDHDGVSNLLEYASGGNPLHSDPVATWQDPPAGGFIQFYYRRSIIALAELQFQVEWNDGLSPDGWHSLGVAETVLSDDGAIQLVNAHVPTNGKPSRFVHLKVTSP